MTKTGKLTCTCCEKNKKNAGFRFPSGYVKHVMQKHGVTGSGNVNGWVDLTIKGRKLSKYKVETLNSLT